MQNNQRSVPAIRIRFNVRPAVFISFFIILLFCINVSTGAQPGNSTEESLPIVDGKSYLWLNGSEQSIIDNALRCFDLYSVGTVADSIYRIWRLDLYKKSKPNNFGLSMLEIGKNFQGYFAVAYRLTWIYKDSALLVTSINRKKLQPKSGWKTFNEKVLQAEINQIHEKPMPTNIQYIDGPNSFQFVTQTRTITIPSFYSPYPNRLSELFLKFKLLIFEEFPNEFFDYTISKDDSSKEY